MWEVEQPLMNIFFFSYLLETGKLEDAAFGGGAIQVNVPNGELRLGKQYAILYGQNIPSIFLKKAKKSFSGKLKSI